MANSLFIGVTGLVANQKLLEVVGNNLANLNTTAYKSRRVVFADLIYETQRSASGPVAGVLGGTNPSQVGTGAIVSSIDANFSQGNLDRTGRDLDFAIDGDGFFVANDGTKNTFTRAGAFALDEAGTLVDGTTGYRIQRVGTAGEPAGVNPGFQTPGNNDIVIPFGTTIQGTGTTTVDISGNLDASLTQALAEVLTSSTPYLAAAQRSNKKKTRYQRCYVTAAMTGWRCQ